MNKTPEIICRTCQAPRNQSHTEISCILKVLHDTQERLSHAEEEIKLLKKSGIRMMLLLETLWKDCNSDIRNIEDQLKTLCDDEIISTQKLLNIASLLLKNSKNPNNIENHETIKNTTNIENITNRENNEINKNTEK